MTLFAIFERGLIDLRLVGTTDDLEEAEEWALEVSETDETIKLFVCEVKALKAFHGGSEAPLGDKDA